jgi:hypothetical protein
MAIVHVIQESVLGCKSVAFDAHAILRMQERGVNEDEVVDVLRNPDQTGLPTTTNRFRYRKNLGTGHHLDVVFEHDPTQIVVISVIRRWGTCGIAETWSQERWKMAKQAFRLEASVDEKTGGLVAVYMRVREGDVAETREVQEGVANADYDSQGLLLGVELLGPCQVEVLDRVSAGEPEPVRRFLRGGAPRELVPAWHCPLNWYAQKVVEAVLSMQRWEW